MTTIAAPLEFADIEPATIDNVYDEFADQQWTDGLPVVPPTKARVDRMLEASPLPRETVLGDMPPRHRRATIEHIAVNAVMAGCRPEYFPVVVAAIEAMLDPDFNLYGVQATTNPVGVSVVVNGPIATRLDINSGFNLFGPGWRANATIGRSIRLCMLNIGGALPGIGDMSTLGNPNKYGSCFAENEAESPWESYHVEAGYSPGASTVTVLAVTAPQNVIVLSAGAEDILDGIAAAIQTSGSNTVRHAMQLPIVLCPVHAHHLENAGYTKRTVREYLWEKSRIAIDHLPETDLYAIRGWKKDCITFENGREMISATETPDDLAIFVAGGKVGPHSAILPAFNKTRIVTRPIS